MRPHCSRIQTPPTPVLSTYKTNDSFLDYEFFSAGPKGRIKKAVRFTRIAVNVFNLGFGDLNEYTGEINDISITNNEDSKKVLATVATIVYDFTLLYPAVWVMAKGSTLSRNRLYRIGIVTNLHEIKSRFEIFGLKDNKWESFKLQIDYSAFLIRRK